MTKRLSLAAGFLFLLAVPAMAQRTTATIRGVVSDPTNAVVSGAKVTIKNEDTGLTRSGTTNASGIYTFQDLPVGSYRLDVEYPGFKAESRSKIVLNVADNKSLDVQLTTGNVTETVNVKDKGLLGGSDLSVSGAAVTANMWTVDGANNNDVGSNRTILVYPSVEAIEEFKIHRNSYGAEYGQAAGAQINIVTRGGTNEFHGSGFYFGRNDALNATNYFIEKAGQPKDQLSRHDFGWTLGGPIVKDKLHFFASQEWNREQRGTVRAAFVPTAAERAGDFSGPAIAGCTNPTPVDPLTGQAFPGNKIPSNRLSRGGQLYLSLYPLPNTTPGPGSCNNWVDSLNSPINWRQENVRMDWSLTNSTRLMMRYTQDSWTNNSP